ncbi:outer membrane lipoprotein carrier protein LolA [Heyndrickxia oleronia]|uniref:LolA family protein n=1 Tax=Heyndrickxia oleronia TaxID=38875 RepID=UPI00204049F0|nr:outer membrane lipoprotein carrier protein LolA [Heyndrickxia oleronia]MCM3456309.1 outer membrane lipoprotein carrier protein LolA [Heyndrickxia oleronia]
MKRKVWMLVVALAAILVLSACGSKSQEDVVKKLDEQMGELKGYKANAKMTLQMGNEPQTYDIEIWYSKPNYYRVHLKNDKKEQSQMILRNKEGVYVLTPALNKSYKFQSDWPKNSSQAYLYESLVKDILSDKDATFKATDDQYVFETKTRYQNNKMLPYQEITFNKKNLSPNSVKVMDTDRKTLVAVQFTKVEFNAKFDKNAFNTNKNLTGAKLDIPVNAKPDEDEFIVKYPTVKIGDTALLDEKEINTEDGKRVVLTYTGEKSFTMTQEKAEVLQTAIMAPTPMSGEMVDLGFAVGTLTDQSIAWTQDGVDYMIASNDLTDNELIEVAQSVQEEPVK